MKFLFNIFLLLLFSINSSFSKEKVVLFKFTKDELPKLKSHSIKKKTDYTILVEQSGACIKGCLKAEAEGQASGLGKEIKVNLNKTPYLNITWKVEKGLPGIKENTKKGHDFAARVSVIKETGSLPWQKKVMNYVFSSNEKTNAHWVGPYRKQIIDYVASSLVDTKEGTWVTAKLNVKDHFKDFLELDVNEIDGVAIMTDTDNTKKKVISYYRDVYFSD